MDLNWCLSCGRRIDDDFPSAYCSRQCQHHDSPTPSPSYVPDSSPSSASEDEAQETISTPPSTAASQWVGKGHDGILAWALAIPAGAAAGAPSPQEFTTPPSPSLRALRPPKLLQPSHRPLPPTLCMSTPQPSQHEPSLPITTPKQHMTSLSLRRRKSDESSSLTSAVTESIATPSSLNMAVDYRKASVLGALATQMRSWVCPEQQQQQPQRYPDPPKRAATTHSSFASNTYRDAPPSALGKTNHSPALRIFSPSDDPGLDEAPADPRYLLSSVTAPDSKLRDDEAIVEKTAKNHLSEQRRRPERADHPAYRSRGRALVRAR